MCIIRLLVIPGGGVSACQGGGGVCLGQECLPDTPSPCEQKGSQTGVKTLPCRNYVVDGKNSPNHSDNISGRFQMNGKNSVGH